MFKCRYDRCMKQLMSLKYPCTSPYTGRGSFNITSARPNILTTHFAEEVRQFALQYLQLFMYIFDPVMQRPRAT